MVMDVALMPKMEKKVHAKPGGKAEGGKWIEQSLQVPDDKTLRRIKLLVVGGRGPRLVKLQVTLKMSRRSSEQLKEDFPVFMLFTTTPMKIPRKDIRLCKIHPLLEQHSWLACV